MGYKKIPTTSTSTTTQTNSSSNSQKSWTESNVSKATKKQLSQAEKAYRFSYADAQKKNIDQILNSKPFAYNLNADGLYQQYAKQYQAMGNTAMKDTMANAAALTGGYGNSYATTAGQQVYNNYMQELNNIVPELYQQAYSRYTAEKEDLYNKANMFSAMDANERSQYDADRTYAYGKYNDEWNRNAKTYANSTQSDKATNTTTSRDEQVVSTGTSSSSGSSSKSSSKSGSVSYPTRSYTAAKKYLESEDFDEEDYRDMMTQSQWENNKTATAREGDSNYVQIQTARRFNTYDEYLAYYIQTVLDNADV